MALALDPQTVRWSIIVGAAFLPSLVLLGILRGTERSGRERWLRLLAVFALGATATVALTLALTPLALPIAGALRPDIARSILVVVVVAPIVEEAVKGWGATVGRGWMTRLPDGLVYGAAVGLGFAATENLLYEVSALQQDGLVAWGVLVATRSVSSALLHPAATALTGLGIAWTRTRNLPGFLVIPFYGGAVALHAAYNWIAVAMPNLQAGGWTVSVRLPAAIALALLAWSATRSLVARLSR